jgi:hypothetical protein
LGALAIANPGRRVADGKPVLAGLQQVIVAADSQEPILRAAGA